MQDDWCRDGIVLVDNGRNRCLGGSDSEFRNHHNGGKIESIPAKEPEDIWVIHNSALGMIGFATSEKHAEKVIERMKGQNTNRGMGKSLTLYSKRLTKME
jgi:hypothetical protein